MHAPIILIGTHRSGTTMLGEFFAQHPEVAYWVEPRWVWTWGNAYKPDDVLTAADASPRVKRHIQAAFERYVRHNGDGRLCEKTPSNCFRIPFIRAIFPDAKLVHIIRDGRSVVCSTRKILRTGAPPMSIASRALKVPITEWPAYAPRAVKQLWRQARRESIQFWGPRPPGWRQWVQKEPEPVLLARQWAATVSAASRDCEQLDDSMCHAFHYEELMASPGEVFARLLAFTGLARCDELIEHVERSVDASRQRIWRDELSQDDLEQMRPELEPTLVKLGYQW